MLRFSLLSLVLFPSLLVAQASGPGTSSPIGPDALRTRLFALAHDSMGGRDTGTPGNHRAAEWIASEFRRFGLEPAGESGTYFQTIPFVRIAADPRSRIEAGGAPLDLGRDYVPVGPPMNRVLDGVEAVFGGHLTNQQGWLGADAARGRLVVLTVPPAADGRRQLVRGAVGRTLADPRLAEAAAVVLAELDLLPSGTAEALLQGNLTADTAALGSGGRVTLFISPRATEALLGPGHENLSPGAAGRTVRGQIAFTSRPLQYPARNVVAVLRGRDPALRNTYVSLSAHNDHVGMDTRSLDHDSLRAHNRVMRPLGADTPDGPPNVEQQRRIASIRDSLLSVGAPRRDSIFNGADDDGSGTVALLEIARSLSSGQRPRRSVLFVSHTAEERGLLGSRWFTDHPTVPRDSIVAEIDEDMIGRGGADDLPAGGPAYLEVIGARRLSREFGDILERVNARQSRPFRFDYTYDAPGHPLQYYCRADHYSYARYGIPSVALSRGEHLDYHQLTDEPQYIRYEDLARVAMLVRDVALEIANLDHRPLLDGPRQDPNAPCRQ